MTTTLYLHATSASETMPNVKQTGDVIDWYDVDSAGSMAPRDMSITIGSSRTNLTGASRTETKSTTYKHFHGCWISPIVSAGQSLAVTDTVTITLDAVESAANHNAYPRFYVYVWTAGDTIGTILYSSTKTTAEIPIASKEADTTYSGASTAISNPHTFSSGDRICVEVMFECTPGANGSYSDILYFDSGSAPGISSLNISKTLSFVSIYATKLTESYKVKDGGWSASFDQPRKAFKMRFGSNADRPKESIKIAAPTTGFPAFRFKYLRTLTQGFKVVVTAGWPKIRASYRRRLIENAVSGFNGVIDKFVSTRGSKWRRKFPESFKITGTLLTKTKWARKFPDGFKIVASTTQKMLWRKKLADAIKVAPSFLERETFKRKLSESFKLVDATKTVAKMISRLAQGIKVSTTPGVVLRAVQKLSQGMKFLGTFSYTKTGGGGLSQVLQEAIRITATVSVPMGNVILEGLRVTDHFAKTLYKVCLSSSLVPVVPVFLWTYERVRRWWKSERN